MSFKPFQNETSLRRTESLWLTVLLFHFGEVFPVAAGHGSELLFQVEAFTDGDGFDILLPVCLITRFTFFHDVVVDFSG